MSDPRYRDHLRERSEVYKVRAQKAYKYLSQVEHIIAPKPAGAFYVTIVFKDGVLPSNGTLPIENEQVREYIEGQLENVPPDKRFVYYLLAATGICVVPLSSFNSDLYGFRITLLEPDNERFEWIFRTLADSIRQYVTSAA